MIFVLVVVLTIMTGLMSVSSASVRTRVMVEVWPASSRISTMGVGPSGPSTIQRSRSAQ
ncbi:hypothetical protein D3C72_2362020 [compost metagenome]